MTALLAAPTRATDAVAARAREASSIDDGEDVDRTTTRDGDERASDERADADDASASGSQPMGSLESESSPMGSLASDEEADEDDERRRATRREEGMDAGGGEDVLRDVSEHEWEHEESV